MRQEHTPPVKTVFGPQSWQSPRLERGQDRQITCLHIGHSAGDGAYVSQFEGAGSGHVYAR